MPGRAAIEEGAQVRDARCLVVMLTTIEEAVATPANEAAILGQSQRAGPMAALRANEKRPSAAVRESRVRKLDPALAAVAHVDGDRAHAWGDLAGCS